MPTVQDRPVTSAPAACIGCAGTGVQVVHAGSDNGVAIEHHTESVSCFVCSIPTTGRTTL